MRCIRLELWLLAGALTAFLADPPARVFLGINVNAQTYASVKTLETKCAKNDGIACGLLSSYYLQRPRTEDNLKKVFESSRIGCDQGSAIGCNNLGIAYYTGGGTDKDLAKAIAPLEYACKHEEMAACGYLGMMYQDGEESFDQDYDKAITLYTRACDSGMGFTCAILAQLYRDGEGVERSLDVAGPLYKQACLNEFESACVEFGYALAYGHGMEVNEAQAFRLFSSHCKRNTSPGSCYPAYIMASNGIGTKESLPDAVDFLAQDCSRDRLTSCTEIAKLHFMNEALSIGDENAARIAIDSCEHGISLGCDLAHYAYSNGIGVGKDLPKAEGFRQKACDGGMTEACD